ncbi:hypothetical protein FAZ95_12140 [Trinickia violacea]|uniref:Uncharacterized protein n=1 Tax=Trinickia violacea TaxID=2571746 RepID=A0A4P8IRX5_9BURK|nr:hypothetical protein FAZ95_12140 [Trinickia violacea]
MSRLRSLVERWLAPIHAAPVRISRFGDVGSGQRRHVRIEVLRPEGAVVILFFRHDDGTWHVFPQQRERISMGVGKAAE